MKTNSLILLASLAVLAISASAAQSQPETDVVVLPAYVVNTPRYEPAEQKLNASLQELRQQAASPAFLAVEAPMLKTPVLSPVVMERAGRDAMAVRLAKL